MLINFEPSQTVHSISKNNHRQLNIQEPMIAVDKQSAYMKNGEKIVKGHLAVCPAEYALCTSCKL